MLRTRLFLNLVPFVVILLAMGLYAVSLFSRLASHVNVIVMKNYQSVVAAQKMHYAVGRMQMGALLVFEDLKDLGRDIFDQARTNLHQELDLQIKSTSPGGEKDLTQSLVDQCGVFESVASAIFAETNSIRRREAYDTKFNPAFDRINGLLDRILSVNHSAILATNESATRIVSEVSRLMFLGMAIALLIASYACYTLGKSILRPIQSLTQATRQLGAGRLEAPVPVTSRDELGELAQAFNKMAAQLQAYRRSTSEEILHLHQTMETTLASFTDPIFVLNRQGRVELKNPVAERLAQRLGWQDDLPAPLGALVRQVLTTGNNYVPNDFKDAIHFRIDKESYYFLPRLLAMKQEDGSLPGVAVVLYEITRFRWLDDMKTNLVATVSHELKTPLTSIRMVLHLLLEKSLGRLNRKQYELVQTAQDDAERLLRILNDLLDLARLEVGGVDLRKEKTDPSTLVRQEMEAMRDRATAAGVTLDAQVAPALPEVNMDRQRISLVFQNLLANAIKHSPNPGAIQVRAQWADGESVEFVVTDEGPGIPQAYRNQVFERFFRVPGQNSAGAGLGLSIAREIVLAHGGRIGVRSRTDRGSEFYFVLPADGLNA
jgi:signal transduction histidine kinase